MEEPCLHVPLDHVHEGWEVVVAALCMKDLMIHNASLIHY
jgi:hypothetical protein